MKKYTGQCHCGEIKFSFETDEIKEGLRCNCSICKRKGAVMTTMAFAPEDFHIETNGKALGCYQFNDKVAEHYFCQNCGIYPFHVTMRQPGHYRANLGCVDEVDVFSLELSVFDGSAL